MRDSGDELGLAPVPGLGDVEALVETFRAGGLTVDAQVRLPEGELTGGLDVSAYRIVQELLTNALRYAEGPVRLTLAPAHGELVISCSNRCPAEQAARGSGLGLQGVAERVGLLGGTMTLTEEDGRFTVEAHLPLATRVAP